MPSQRPRWKHHLVAALSTILVSPVFVEFSVVSGFVARSRRLPLLALSDDHHRKQRQPVSSSATLTTTDCIQCWAKSKKSPRQGGGGVGGTGGGGGGFGAKTVSASSAASMKKTMLKKVQEKYGGTTRPEIARGTQQQIEAAIKQLPAHIQMAIQIYQQLQKWNAHVAGLSVLDQTTKVSSAELDGAKRAQEELNRLYQQHDISARDIHNILQQITWDASADAKAARSVTGNMPTDIETRVDRACEIVAEALRTAAIEQSPSSSKADAKAKSEGGRMLDVGCGFGVLVPHLIKAGVQASQIFGVDLSPEMIRNAQEMHSTKKNGGPFFDAVDFLSDEYRGPKSNHDTDNVVGSAGSCFDSIIFCSSLHDMPDVVGAIRKASLLLRPGGKLVLVHPQGASHVLNQVRSNPALVTRGLPDAKELQTLCADIDIGLELVVEPANAASKEEAVEGYLAVLQKRRIL